VHECIVGVGEGVKAKNEKWLSARDARVGEAEGEKKSVEVEATSRRSALSGGGEKRGRKEEKADGFRTKVRRFSREVDEFERR
jgi:hypothetical protein